MLKYVVLIACFFLKILYADFSYDLSIVHPRLNILDSSVPYPKVCFEILNAFAESASNFTFCSLINARPIRLCENCEQHYVRFHDKYKELKDTAVNGTSCSSLLMSQDRLNVIQHYHDSILGIWDKGNCNDCFVWSNETATVKNSTTRFYKLFNATMECIVLNMASEKTIVCEKCMQNYLQLDEFYKTLSKDKIGVDCICMDIVDSMNATRSIWSKTLECCVLRKTPEVVFLLCTGLISFLPILFYITVRFCGPIRDLPNILKQSRFKQTILRSIDNSRIS
ncbi:osteopetrosis-associated transmembrane protein 1 [Pieris rapae]|uniref:osteopetrosis-associated transmembrane protein 1 n=1 Tax=Pieris rapae TaxID=64459 RepID=UPI000B92B502|nr:osteopetrosis-associated transmembrane protein 1 [Pieris rapae]